MLTLVLSALLPLPQDPPPQADKKSESGTSIIPIPFFSTSRNSGNSYGALVALMFADAKGDITQLVVPKFEYFEASRSNYSVDYFGYPTDDSSYDFFALWAAKDDCKYSAEYENTRVAGSRWAVRGEASYWTSNSERFFGIGAGSDSDNETNYMLRERKLILAGGYHAFPDAVLWFQERIRKTTISRGGLHDLPYLRALFPQTPGLEDGTVVHEELRLSIDSRDSAGTPTEGLKFDAWLGLRHYFETDASPSAPIWSGGVDLASVWPFDADRRFILAAHFRIEFTKGRSDDVPFLEMVSVGGNSLRGYGENRFVDLNAILLSVEKRINVWNVVLFGVKGNVEVAPFIDMGKVFRNMLDELLRNPVEDFQLTGGIGFRGVVPPFIVGRVEFGFGRDGMVAFVGLDYPY